MDHITNNKLLFHCSTHNYSSLYGEFYCISHYQQLFKRKGNYDEGFGHTQHKDRWLCKDKTLDEPDARPTIKITKSSLKTSAGVVFTMASTRELGNKSDADVKGRLKTRWPPEKTKAGVNPTQPTNAPVLINSFSDINKAASVTASISEGWKTGKISQRGETREKAVKEQTKTSFVSSEKISSETPGPGHRPITIPTTESRVSLMSSENGTPFKKTVHTRKVPNGPGASQNKLRKSVWFAPDVDVAQGEQSCQLSSEDTSEMISDQSEKIPNNIAAMSDNTKVDSFSNSQNQELRRNPDVPQTGVTSLTAAVKEVNDPLHSQSLTETFDSTDNTVKQQEPSENPDIISGDPVNLNGPETPAKGATEEEVSVKTNENRLAKPNLSNDQEHSRDPKKPVARTNSKTIKGSWSKGKSPLSKLFMSSGNDQTARSEPKDAKKPEVKASGGILGRLFHSSSDVTKPPERNIETQTEDKNMKKEKEAPTEEKQKTEDTSEVAFLELGGENHIKSESVEPGFMESNSRATDPINQGSITETKQGLTAPGETGESSTNEQPKSQDSVASDPPVSDPEIQSEGSPPDVALLHTVHEESITESTPDKSTDEILKDPFRDDIFGGDESSALSPHEVPVQISPDPKPGKVSDLPDEMGGNLISAELFDLSCEQQDSSKSFELSNIPSPTPSSSVRDTHEPVEASADFSLIDSEPASSPPDVHDSEPLKQDNISDPFGAINQTSELTADFDIFNSNDSLFSQLPTASDQRAAEAPTNHSSAFPDDIFGASEVSSSADVFAATFNPLNDLLGSESSFTAVSSGKIDLFADMFAPEVQLLAPPEPRNAVMFGDSLLESEDKKTEQKSEGGSWMDDLLG